MSFRTHPNGDVEFIKRGKPPNHLSGYVQDSDNPYLFHIDLEPCRFRDAKLFSRPCPSQNGFRTVQCIYCKLFSKDVTPAICDDCEVEDK